MICNGCPPPVPNSKVYKKLKKLLPGNWKWSGKVALGSNIGDYRCECGEALKNGFIIENEKNETRMLGCICVQRFDKDIYTEIQSSVKDLCMLEKYYINLDVLKWFNSVLDSPKKPLKLSMLAKTEIAWLNYLEFLYNWLPNYEKLQAGLNNGIITIVEFDSIVKKMVDDFIELEYIVGNNDNLRKAFWLLNRKKSLFSISVNTRKFIPEVKKYLVH